MSKRNILKIFAKTTLKVVVLLGLTGGVAFAAGNVSAITLTTISKNVDDSVKSLAIILSDVSLIAGIGFIMASFFKFHQHKLNPTQVPISQGVTLLLIGAGLALFPYMLPTATKAVFGTGSVNHIGGGEISGLISGGGSS